MLLNEQKLIYGNLPKPLRAGCHDVWKASFVDGAEFSSHDIPLCPTDLPNGLPSQLISYPRAKTLYNKQLKFGNVNFHHNAFVHFYCDDYRFDGPKNSIWTYSKEALDILRHFDGIITPDFSTYADFPDPIKRYNTYRMRAFGYACHTEGIPVINNVRWGTCETWEYCFDGIETGSVICIGTVASDYRDLDNRQDFDEGYIYMLHELSPRIILVYGSSKYAILQTAARNGIQIISFPSETQQAYRKGDDT